MNSYIQVQQQAKFFVTLTDFLFNSDLLSAGQRDNFESTAHDLNSLQFYKIVCRRGGYQAVTNRNQWSSVATQLSSDKQESSLRSFYYEYLYPYQQKYYFGKQIQVQLPNIICGKPRKMVKFDSNIQSQQPITNQSIQKFSSIQQPSKTLEQQIRKRFQQQQKVGKIFYINKQKLIQTKAQNKKIILGLQPFMDRKNIIYSLNMLLFYSVNTDSPFLFQNNQKIFNVMVNFTNSIYPLKNQQNYEDLRVITLIFRNLTLNPINLKFILGTPIFELFIKIFNQGVDKQCSKNIIDMMSGLVKVGWDCNRIIQNISDALLNNQKQSIKDMIELLRGLVDQREENLFNIIPDNINIINRILMNKQIDIDVKQQVFQIISFVTQSSLQARQIISKNHFLIGIIVGILQNMRNHEKLTQLSILILNNISNSMNGKTIIKQFQNQLMIIGFTDDSLAGILSHILADVAHL